MSFSDGGIDGLKVFEMVFPPDIKWSPSMSADKARKRGGSALAERGRGEKTSPNVHTNLTTSERSFSTQTNRKRTEQTGLGLRQKPRLFVLRGFW